MTKAEDLAFVRDVDNWGSGPCLQVACFPRDPARLAGLDAALRRDRFVVESVDEVTWGPAFAWAPDGIPAIGLRTSQYHANELHIWTYPPFVERATGHPDLTPEAMADPRTWRLHRALLGLVQRLHSAVPLRFAEIVEEARESCLGDVVKGAVMYKRIAEGCGLPIRRVLGEHAVIAFDGGTPRDGEPAASTVP